MSPLAPPFHRRIQARSNRPGGAAFWPFRKDRMGRISPLGFPPLQEGAQMTRISLDLRELEGLSDVSDDHGFSTPGRS